MALVIREPIAPGEGPPQLPRAERLAATAVGRLSGVEAAIGRGAEPNLVERDRFLQAHASRSIDIAAGHRVAGHAGAQDGGIARRIVVALERIEQEAEARLVAGGNGALVGSVHLRGKRRSLGLVRGRKSEVNLHDELSI